MSIANNRTFELWKSFMPLRAEIKNRITTDLISLQVYNPTLSFNDFDLNTEFEKWAVAEVSDFEPVPEGMETFLLTGGQYAVFIYKGAPADFGGTFNYIFKTWLPASEFELDNRPHFEVLGSKYKNNSPDSEEEVWIPVRDRNIIL